MKCDKIDLYYYLDNLYLSFSNKTRNGNFGRVSFNYYWTIKMLLGADYMIG